MQTKAVNQRNILIVYAHHDPQSFVAAMLERARTTLINEGHKVLISDLHRMAFKAVADDADFIEQSQQSDGLDTDYQSRQRTASEHGSYSPDILAELEKLDWADGVIFLFPYYWFHFPAILKGWFDRVFAYDRIYSNEHPLIGAYARGGLRGKRAMIGVTFGAPEPEHGPVPSRHSERFEPIQNGVLAYAGFDVMSPFYAWSVVQVGLDRRIFYLNEWEHRVSSMFSDEPELRAALGPTHQPPKLFGRVRKHGDRVYPYGGDCSLAGFAAVERLKAKPGFADDLRSRLESLVYASRTDSSTRIMRCCNLETMLTLYGFFKALRMQRLRRGT